jgi:hypothetical protein
LEGAIPVPDTALQPIFGAVVALAHPWQTAVPLSDGLLGAETPAAADGEGPTPHRGFAVMPLYVVAGLVKGGMLGIWPDPVVSASYIGSSPNCLANLRSKCDSETGQNQTEAYLMDLFD